MKTIASLSALLLAAGFAAACVAVPPSGVAYVRVRPPHAVVELRAESPGPGWVWIEGYHRWDGGAYVWVPGRWERAPEGRRHWVRGRWRSYHGQWYWTDGHWD